MRRLAAGGGCAHEGLADNRGVLGTIPTIVGAIPTIVGAIPTVVGTIPTIVGTGGGWKGAGYYPGVGTGREQSSAR